MPASAGMTRLSSHRRTPVPRKNEMPAFAGMTKVSGFRRHDE